MVSSTIGIPRISQSQHRCKCPDRPRRDGTDASPASRRPFPRKRCRTPWAKWASPVWGWLGWCEMVRFQMVTFWGFIYGFFQVNHDGLINPAHFLVADQKKINLNLEWAMAMWQLRLCDYVSQCVVSQLITHMRRMGFHCLFSTR